MKALFKGFFMAFLVWIPVSILLAALFFLIIFILPFVISEEYMKYIVEMVWGPPLLIYAYIVTLIGIVLHEHGIITWRKKKPSQ